MRPIHPTDLRPANLCWLPFKAGQAGMACNRSAKSCFRDTEAINIFADFSSLL